MWIPCRRFDNVASANSTNSVAMFIVQYCYGDVIVGIIIVVLLALLENCLFDWFILLNSIG